MRQGQEGAPDRLLPPLVSAALLNLLIMVHREHSAMNGLSCWQAVQGKGSVTFNSHRNGKISSTANGLDVFAALPQHCASLVCLLACSREIPEHCMFGTSASASTVTDKQPSSGRFALMELEQRAKLEDVDADDDEEEELITFKTRRRHAAPATSGTVDGPKRSQSAVARAISVFEDREIARKAQSRPQTMGVSWTPHSNSVLPTGRAGSGKSGLVAPPLAVQSSNAQALSSGKPRSGRMLAGNGRQHAIQMAIAGESGASTTSLAEACHVTPSKRGGRLSFEHVTAVVDSGRKSSRKLASPARGLRLSPSQPTDGQSSMNTTSSSPPARPSRLQSPVANKPRHEGALACDAKPNARAAQTASAAFPGALRADPSRGPDVVESQPAGRAVEGSAARSDAAAVSVARLESAEAAAASARSDAESLRKRLDELRRGAGPAAVEALRADLRHSQQVLERVREQRDAYAKACQDAAARIEDLQGRREAEAAARAEAEAAAEAARAEAEASRSKAEAAAARAEVAEAERQASLAAQRAAEELALRAQAELAGARNAAEGSERRFDGERARMSDAVSDAAARASKAEEALEAVRAAFGKAKAQASAAAEAAAEEVAEAAAEAVRAKSAAKTQATRDAAELSSMRAKMTLLAEELRKATSETEALRVAGVVAANTASQSVADRESLQTQLKEAQAEVGRLQAELVAAGKTQEELMGMLEELQAMA